MMYQEKIKAFWRNNYVRTALRSVVYHLAFSIFAYLLFVFIISNILKPMVKDGLIDAIRLVIGIMSAGLYLVAQIWIANAYYKDHANKKRYLDMTSEGKSHDTATRDKILGIALLESLLTTLAVAVMALPSAVFYARWGYEFGKSLFFENWSIGFVGIYQLLGDGWLGYFLALGLCFGIAMIGRTLSHRDWEINRIQF